MISLWGCLPVSSFLNQALQFYSLTYLNLKPSGGSYAQEFPEGADIKGSEDSLAIRSLLNIIQCRPVIPDI